MKLTKAKLNRLVRKGIENLGYTFFKDSLTGFQGLYAKYLGNGFYLTLGLTIHRYYYDAFTADLYLSKTTNIAAFWGDIPNDSYIRLGFLLTEEERSIYNIDNSLNSVNGNPDIWWHSGQEGPNNIFNFLQTLKIAEQKLLRQKSLIRRIEESVDVNKLLEQSERVIEIYKRNEFKATYKCIPSKNIDDIPMDWFKAAEEAIVSVGETPTIQNVKGLAAKSYRMAELLYFDRSTYHSSVNIHVDAK